MICCFFVRINDYDDDYDDDDDDDDVNCSYIIFQPPYHIGFQNSKIILSHMKLFLSLDDNKSPPGGSVVSV